MRQVTNIPFIAGKLKHEENFPPKKQSMPVAVRRVSGVFWCLGLWFTQKTMFSLCRDDSGIRSGGHFLCKRIYKAQLLYSTRPHSREQCRVSLLQQGLWWDTAPQASMMPPRVNKKHGYCSTFGLGVALLTKAEKQQAIALPPPFENLVPVLALSYSGPCSLL